MFWETVEFWERARSNLFHAQLTINQKCSSAFPESLYLLMHFPLNLKIILWFQSKGFRSFFVGEWSILEHYYVENYNKLPSFLHEFRHKTSKILIVWTFYIFLFHFVNKVARKNWNAIKETKLNLNLISSLLNYEKILFGKKSKFLFCHVFKNSTNGTIMIKAFVFVLLTTWRINLDFTFKTL